MSKKKKKDIPIQMMIFLESNFFCARLIELVFVNSETKKKKKLQ